MLWKKWAFRVNWGLNFRYLYYSYSCLQLFTVLHYTDHSFSGFACQFILSTFYTTFHAESSHDGLCAAGAASIRTYVHVSACGWVLLDEWICWHSFKSTCHNLRLVSENDAKLRWLKQRQEKDAKQEMSERDPQEEGRKERRLERLSERSSNLLF